MKVLKWILLTVSAIVVAAFVYLLVVAVIPGFEVPSQPLQKIRGVVLTIQKSVISG